MEGKESVEKRFVVDSMLGKVAKWLRVLGFDTQYQHILDQRQLDSHRRDGRLLVTRNRRWCNENHVICLSANDPMEQLREVVSLIPITEGEIQPLHRCVSCNQVLEARSRDAVFGHVPDYVFETAASFFQCPKCRKVYWPGSHPKRMLERLQQVLGWKLERWIH